MVRSRLVGMHVSVGRDGSLPTPSSITVKDVKDVMPLAILLICGRMSTILTTLVTRRLRRWTDHMTAVDVKHVREESVMPPLEGEILLRCTASMIVDHVLEGSVSPCHQDGTRQTAI